MVTGASATAGLTSYDTLNVPLGPTLMSPRHHLTYIPLTPHADTIVARLDALADEG